MQGQPLEAGGFSVGGKGDARKSAKADPKKAEQVKPEQATTKQTEPEHREAAEIVSKSLEFEVEELTFQPEGTFASHLSRPSSDVASTAMSDVASKAKKKAAHLKALAGEKAQVTHSKAKETAASVTQRVHDLKTGPDSILKLLCKNIPEAGSRPVTPVEEPYTSSVADGLDFEIEAVLPPTPTSEENNPLQNVFEYCMNQPELHNPINEACNRLLFIHQQLDVAKRDTEQDDVSQSPLTENLERLKQRSIEDLKVIVYSVSEIPLNQSDKSLLDRTITEFLENNNFDDTFVPPPTEIFNAHIQTLKDEGRITSRLDKLTAKLSEGDPKTDLAKAAVDTALTMMGVPKFVKTFGDLVLKYDPEKAKSAADEGMETIKEELKVLLEEAGLVIEETDEELLTNIATKLKDEPPDKARKEIRQLLTAFMWAKIKAKVTSEPTEVITSAAKAVVKGAAEEVTEAATTIVGLAGASKDVVKAAFTSRFPIEMEGKNEREIMKSFFIESIEEEVRDMG